MWMSSNPRRLALPLHEECNTLDSGALAAKLLRWGNNTHLYKDAMLNGPLRYGPKKYFEPNWLKWRREMREKIAKKYDEEVKNTAEMALWHSFRVNSKPGTFDREVYDKYIEMREQMAYEKKLQRQNKELWTVKDCYYPPKIKQQKQLSPEEIAYQESMQPEQFLNRMKTSFKEWKKDERDEFDSWKIEAFDEPGAHEMNAIENDDNENENKNKNKNGNINVIANKYDDILMNVNNDSNYNYNISNHKYKWEHKMNKYFEGINDKIAKNAINLNENKKNYKNYNNDNDNDNDNRMNSHQSRNDRLKYEQQTTNHTNNKIIKDPLEL